MKTAAVPDLISPKKFTFAVPPDRLKLESGQYLGPIDIQYETYGKLNPDRSNAILLLHALSGDSHVAGRYRADDRKPGWWDEMVGPGRAFDTNRYFVICSNVLGGCRGSTGPASLNPETGRPYGLQFPVITIGDIVNCQRRLVDHLGIEKLYCLAGGSMGGMQVLQWLAAYPERIAMAIPIATTLRHSPQQIAFDAVGRQSIMADPAWNGGDYYGREVPARGLAIARMVGHITYMSEKSMEEKFGRQLKDKKYAFSFSTEFEVEGYLDYRGDSFVKRFDANSYLYLTKAMDYFDLEADFGRNLFRGLAARILVLSFSSDWLYPPGQSKEIVRVMKRQGGEVTYCEIPSSYGHDSFLVEIAEETRLISDFLAAGSKLL
ncbi:MAG TPA: homoserine O-acetyltransferase [bacterium]|nr:homoserine O-acetyltransferase [bacterium]HNS48790.1 homoserine O-acetyltransferase [bacterium]